MSDVKPPTLSGTATLIATLSRRRKEVEVSGYEDLSSNDVQKAIGESGGSAWLAVGEGKKWL